MLPHQDWSHYRARIRDEHAAGWLTRAERDVMIVIANRHATGDTEPTCRAIASDAGCDPRTVRRATAKARGRGLLMVEAQFEPLDGQRRQRANRYEIKLPAEPVMPKPRPSRGGQRVQPIGLVRKKEAYQGVRIDLLAARREAVEAALMARLW